MTPKQLADATLASIQAGDFSKTPDRIRRAYTPQVELKRTDRLEVLIVPQKIETERNDETAWDRSTSIDVGILYKFNYKANAEIPISQVDPFADYADEIAEHFADDDFAIADGVDVIGVDRTLYFANHLTDWRQFTSIITVTFREVT